MTEAPIPAAVYAERFTARTVVIVNLKQELAALSWARLGVFGIGLVAAGLAFGADLFHPLWLFLPVVAFFVLVIEFEKRRGRLAWANRSATYYAVGLHRLEGKPTGLSKGSRYLPDDHPYAADLDLFGPGSLFDRITACRTRVGEETLAAWLKAPASADEVKARQVAVNDLRPRLDLRESLALAGAEIPDGVELNWLTAWGAAPRESFAAWKPWAIAVLGWANVAAWIGWFFAGTSSLPVFACGVLSLIIAMPLANWVRRVLAPIEKAEAGLSLLEAVLIRFERPVFTAPRLVELQAALRSGGASAASQIRELRNLLGWLNSRRNPLFWPVAILRMWGTRYAFKLEAWRARSGDCVKDWLRAVAEAEALSSLAGHAFENPGDVFPTILDGKDRIASFSATGLGHPLLPATGCVRNDVQFGTVGLRLLVISGSNMSGKSTLLRAVGVNAVLALAGGVVRAASLTLTPVALGATMRVQDSLQEGRSRFFAEVSKVRTLLDLARRNEPPLLFLLDEIFAGTNSADRVAGAEGVLNALLAAGAIGLVTTHDLALTAITEHLGQAANVHFCDGFAGGELHFDYTMRPGVVPHGNGLALMRAVGLDV